MAQTSNLTLVCGGGGVWGVAWMTGLAMGLAEHGVDLRRAQAFVGTSAGSVVSTHLAHGFDIAAQFERQHDPAKQPRERGPAPAALDATVRVMRGAWRDDHERLEAIRWLALEAVTISVEDRRADIVERLGLPADAWPAKPLSLTAVDLETLDLQVFDASSGVSLIDAVSASCAVPGVWPPALVDGRRYLDGGVWRSADNAHLAEGASRVLVISPTGRVGGSALGGPGLAADVARLEAQGTRVAVITADEASLQTMAPGALDPATRTPAAEAGRRQAAQEAAAARAIFEGV
jgi:NTE family protein